MGFNVSKDLTVDNILSQISEYDIFMNYCTPFKEVGKMFRSELREDNNPTCKVSVNNATGDLLYGDFNGGRYNCFKYVQVKYNTDFNTALNIINRDFKLGLYPTWANEESKDVAPVKIKPKITNKKFYKTKSVIVKKRQRAWAGKDSDYWFNKYRISRKTLMFFNVQPIDYYWVNDNRFRCKTITYSYEFGDGVRDIYSPFNKYSKFPVSNTKADTHIYGYNQLPETGQFLFIVSSLKEVMVLYEYGISAISAQSESSDIPDKIIQNLKERFTNIVILYDFDESGSRHAKNYGEKWGISYCQFSSDFVEKNGFKDISDGIDFGYKDKVEDIINNYDNYLIKI